ncbi:MAG: hypothetical protein WA144_06920 [Candidatus Methanoperedens sp.]
MDISDYILQIFPKEIATDIIIYGFIYFLLVFYGTKQWENYTGFEKVIFSAMTGGVVWYFFIQPISIFFAILSVFLSGSIDINYDRSQQLFIFLIIFLYLIIWRITYNKPLRDNDHFLNFIKYFIEKLIIFVFFTNGFLLFVFTYLQIIDYMQLFSSYIILYFVNLIIFYCIFLYTFGKDIPYISNNYPKLILNIQKFKSILLENETKIKYLKYIVLFSLILLVGYISDTPYQLKEEKNTSVEVQRIDLRENNENLTGFLDVEQNYTIFFRHLPWIKFKPDISLTNGIYYYKESNYTVSGEYVFVNGTSWKTVNISLKGRKYETNVPKIYEIEKIDLNETIQVWNIRFFNQYDNGIKIHQIVIGNDEKLKLLDFKKYLMSFDVEKLDENIKIQQTSNLTIDKLRVWDNYISSNHSITLFFEKTK